MNQQKVSTAMQRLQNTFSVFQTDLVLLLMAGALANVFGWLLVVVDRAFASAYPSFYDQHCAGYTVSIALCSLAVRFRKNHKHLEHWHYIFSNNSVAIRIVPDIPRSEVIHFPRQ